MNVPPVMIPRAVVFAIGCALLVAGCASREHGIPVRNAGERTISGATVHVVQKGDTLYSIAWRYGLDYRTLAAANGIAPPYTIYIEQKLKLPPAGAAPVADGGPEKPAAAARSPAPTPKGPPAAAPGAPSPVAPAGNAARAVAGSIAWQWPIEGKVVRGFDRGEGLSNGIDIQGRQGQKVASAASGVVVYAGGGLRGYGKLIIVKHSDVFLSAYGHNRVLLVKEGETVKGGQIVAEVGANGAEGDMLHFEIRRNGKPENPLDYLPRR